MATNCNPGRLSLLTEDVVSAAAASEIKTGKRVGLGWSMKKLEFSQFGRQKCGHSIIPLDGPGGSGMGACFDDVYNMNPREFGELFLSLKCHLPCLSATHPNESGRR